MFIRGVHGGLGPRGSIQCPRCTSAVVQSVVSVSASQLGECSVEVVVAVLNRLPAHLGFQVPVSVWPPRLIDSGPVFRLLARSVPPPPPPPGAFRPARPGLTMLYTRCLVGLMAATVVSMPAHYALPAGAKLAAGCATMPGEFAVSDFTTYTGPYNQTTLHFAYSDRETGIETTCERNSTSKPSRAAPSLASRYACDNANVEFIYQTNTGIKGLTVIEAACPDR